MSLINFANPSPITVHYDGWLWLRCETNDQCMTGYDGCVCEFRLVDLSGRILSAMAAYYSVIMVCVCSYCADPDTLFRHNFLLSYRKMNGVF